MLQTRIDIIDLIKSSNRLLPSTLPRVRRQMITGIIMNMMVKFSIIIPLIIVFFITGDYEDYTESEPIRINYYKYGHKNDDSSYGDATDGLPDDIYCDLVTTLSEK